MAFHPYQRLTRQTQGTPWSEIHSHLGFSSLSRRSGQPKRGLKTQGSCRNQASKSVRCTKWSQTTLTLKTVRLRSISTQKRQLTRRTKRGFSYPKTGKIRSSRKSKVSQDSFMISSRNSKAWLMSRTWSGQASFRSWGEGCLKTSAGLRSLALFKTSKAPWASSRTIQLTWRQRTWAKARADTWVAQIRIPETTIRTKQNPSKKP